MTPQKQAFRHKPDEGVYGDCFRTCVACLLDLPRDEIPHDHVAEALSYQRDEDDDPGSQMKRMNAWLAQRGLILFNVVYPDSCTLDDVLATMNHFNPEVHYLLGGMSRTGCGHYVVCKGDKIVCDPSLTDAGIVGADAGYWWISILARLA